MTQYKLDIHPDYDNESPRTAYDQLGTMALFHSRYNLGDDHGLSHEETLEIFKSDNHLCIEVYFYDHGIQSVSCSSFVGRAHHADWDSGCVGIIFISHEDIIKNWGDLSEESLEKAEACLRAEVNEYDMYIRGDVWGYVVSKAKHYYAEDGDVHTEWEEVDSCWGFYGQEYCEEEGKSILEWYQKQEAA